VTATLNHAQDAVRYAIRDVLAELARQAAKQAAVEAATGDAQHLAEQAATEDEMAAARALMAVRVPLIMRIAGSGGYRL
jgi:Arc/MetJ-type ribon-helix-helix transcriptional regulator